MLKNINLLILLMLPPQWLLANSTSLPLSHTSSTSNRLSYYQQQAHQGDVHAMFKLGFAYEVGDGMPANIDSAVDWYTRASQRGHKNARMNLHAMDASGKPFIDTEATYHKELYKKAELGDLNAQNELARMLINNVLKQADRLQILNWVEAQAQRGSSEAQFLIAQMYYLGVAVPQNYIDAYVWYSLAAAAGDLVAMSSRDHVASLMNPSQIEQGQSQSRELFERLVETPLSHPGGKGLDSLSVSSLP